MGNQLVDKYFQKTDDGRLLFYCPGCKFHHVLDDRWSLVWKNKKPRIAPSLLVTYPYGEKQEERRCHLFIKNGNIEYLNDCTHELKGKTVPMEIDNG